MMKGVVEIGFGSEGEARKALSALKAEMVEHERSKSTLEAIGKTLIVRVDAKDAVALRASLNTCLRLVSVMIAGFEEGIKHARDSERD